MTRDITIIVFALVVCALAAVAMRDLQLDKSIDPFLEASEEAIADVRRFERELPPPVVDARVVLRWPREIGREEIEAIRAVAADLRSREGIAGAISLADIPVIEERDGRRVPIQFGRVLELDPELTVDALAARHPLVDGALLSHDHRAAVVQVIKDDPLSDPERLFEALESWKSEFVPDGVDCDLIGEEPINGAIVDLMERDIFRTVLLETLILGLLLPLMFRTFRGSILPLLIVNLAVIVDLGLMAVLGMRFTLLDIAIPGLVLVIGLCDAVHMIHHFELEYAARGDQRAAVASMLRRVGPACFFTSFTTALGFLSLLIAEHELVREFAVKAGLAVLVAFSMVVGLLPVVLRRWPIRRPARDPMRWIGRLSYGKPLLVLGIAAVVAALSVRGGFLVKVDSRWLEELPPDLEVVRDLEAFQRDFHGVMWMEARIEGDLLRPDALAALESVKAKMVRQDGVTRTESIADWLREADANLDGELDAASVQRGAALLRMTGRFFPAHAATPEFDRGRLFIFTGDIGSVRFLELKEYFEGEVAAVMPDGVEAEIQGYLLMANESGQLLIRTMLRSLGLSLAAISLFIMLIYRSVRLGLIAIVPNVVPILVAWGLLGWTGTPLRTGTVMIFSLGLGLAVDDTIHIMTRFRQELGGGGSIHAVLLRALATSGKALITSSIILAVGTLCFLIADFRSLVDIGFLLTAVILSAAVADLFLLPLILEWAFKRSSSPASSDRSDAAS